MPSAAQAGRETAVGSSHGSKWVVVVGRNHKLSGVSSYAKAGGHDKEGSVRPEVEVRFANRKRV